MDTSHTKNHVGPTHQITTTKPHNNMELKPDARPWAQTSLYQSGPRQQQKQSPWKKKPALEQQEDTCPEIETNGACYPTHTDTQGNSHEGTNQLFLISNDQSCVVFSIPSLQFLVTPHPASTCCPQHESRPANNAGSDTYPTERHSPWLPYAYAIYFRMP